MTLNNPSQQWFDASTARLRVVTRTLCNYFFSLIFGIFIASSLDAQNCKALDVKSFFPSVKYGSPIPEDLIACRGKAKTGGNHFIRIEYDSLNARCKKRYSDLFHFMSVPFSFLQITANEKEQILSVQLYSFFDDSQREGPLVHAPPTNFTEIYNTLNSLYGQPTNIEAATTSDSLFVKELGMPHAVAWECNNITLQLRIRYGSLIKEINVIEVSIVNRNFDIPAEVQAF